MVRSLGYGRNVNPAAVLALHAVLKGAHNYAIALTFTHFTSIQGECQGFTLN